MQLLLLLAAWILSGGLSVNVTPIKGPPYQAELVGANESGLSLLVDGEPRQVALDDLKIVTAEQQDELTSPAIQVWLRDGTRLPVDDIEIDGEQAKLKLRRQGTLVVPVRSLGLIRFRSPSAQVNAQWSGFVTQSKPNDQLVVRRGSDTLDAVGGVVRSISDRQVRFDLNGSPVDAPFDRLEGVVFGGFDNTSAPTGKLRVKDRYGVVWNANALGATKPDANGTDQNASQKTVSITTAGGVRHDIRVDLIQSIELASGIVLVASLKPLEQTYQPFIAAPALITGDDSNAWLGIHVQDNDDLIVPSRSSITYRVEPGFARFAAEVQIEPSVILGGRCDVRVLLNDKVAWEQTLHIGEPSQPIEIPLADASRLTLEADYGGDGDIGDLVHVREPRFLK